MDYVESCQKNSWPSPNIYDQNLISYIYVVKTILMKRHFDLTVLFSFSSILFWLILNDPVNIILDGV